MWHHGFGWTDGFGGMWMMGIGLVFWLLVIGGVAVLVVRAVRNALAIVLLRRSRQAA